MKDKKKEKIGLFYRFARVVVGTIARIFFRLNIVGAENIPNQGGFIVAGNHRSMWDVIVLVHAMKTRRLSFLGKEEFFKIPVVNSLFRSLGAFPVKRGSGDFAALDTSSELIKSGHVLNIFPEGTRVLDGPPIKPKSGIGLVVHRGESDVLPFCMYIEGRYRLGRKVTIRFGEMMKYESFNLEETLSSKERKRVTNEIMGEILSLLDKGHGAK